MRDDQIIDIRKRLNGDILLLHNQLVWLRTRQEAYESFYHDRKTKILGFLFPDWAAGAIDKIHLGLMNKYNQEMKEMADKIREDAKKPKIKIIGANGVA